jgi:FkbM family methyltransferase
MMAPIFTLIYKKYFRDLVHKNTTLKVFILWIKVLVPILIKNSRLGRVLTGRDESIANHAKLCIKKLHGQNKKGLFLDLGSNLGQGFSFFKSYYRLRYFDYVLFEPNSNCATFLRRYPFTRVDKSSSVQLYQVAASAQNGTLKFYGINEHAGGAYSQAGSINRDHNCHEELFAQDQKYDIVESRRLSDFLLDSKLGYDTVVVKMDIEGGEYDVVADLLKTDAIDRVSKIYIEFHASLYREPKSSHLKLLEKQLVAELQMRNVDFALWH